MTDSELLEQIQKCVREEFQMVGLSERIRPQNSPFKRAEQILWNYATFDNIIKDKQAQIEEVRKSGVPGKSKSIVEYQPHTGSVSDIVLEEETIDSIVGALETDIVWVQQVLSRINLAIKTVETDPDYPMMADYYFGGNDLETLAIKYKMDRRTVARRKNNLVRKIAMQLFPKESLEELTEGI